MRPGGATATRLAAAGRPRFDRVGAAPARRFPLSLATPFRRPDPSELQAFPPERSRPQRLHFPPQGATFRQRPRLRSNTFRRTEQERHRPRPSPRWRPPCALPHRRPIRRRSPRNNPPPTRRFPPKRCPDAKNSPLGPVHFQCSNALLRQAKLWRGGCDDELKPLVAIQRVRLPPGKGAARQPEGSLAWRAATPVVKRRQQVTKRRAASKSVKR